MPGTSIEQSVNLAGYSKGFYDLPAGTSVSFNFKMVASAGDNNGYIMVKTTACDNAPFKIVTTAGKVRTRAAAKAACEAQGRVLAPVTSATMNDIKAVRDSPDVNLTVFDAFLEW
ncbi:hypothetical protein GGF32_009900 [Allomyces javanicus]|nr:hypothetical protein GGF32_009900 [Allomyces javanicus]